MDEFLKKLDLVSMVDTSKLNTFLLKEKALEFTKIKSENPKFSQVEICKMLGTSDSTMRRIRNDLGIASSFRHTVKSTAIVFRIAQEEILNRAMDNMIDVGLENKELKNENEYLLSSANLVDKAFIQSMH